MKVDFKQLVNDLKKPDGTENYKARVRLRNETARVAGKGHEAERTEFAAALAKAVVESAPQERRRGPTPQLPNPNTPMRSELLRSLCEIATAAEIPILMKASDDFEVRDFIRCAIECIPGDEATTALAQMAVKGEGNEFRVGAINALGKRKTPAAMDALKTCAADPDPRIRLAAADALANIGDPSALPVVAQSFDPRRGWAPHANAARTQLRLAANVAKSGNKPAADQIYRNIGATQPERFQMKAAEVGVQGQQQPRR